VDRETAVVRKRVEDAETAIVPKQEDMRNAETAGLTTRKHDETLEEMMYAFGDGVSDVASFIIEEDGEDEADDEEDTELGKVSEDDEPGWVMGTITNTVPQHMESFRQQRMRLNEFRKPGLGYAADNVGECNKKHRIAELKVPAVVTPQMELVATTPAPKSFGERMETLDIVPGYSQMPQRESPPRCSQMRLGSGKPQSHERIVAFQLNTAPNSLHIKKSKPVQPISFNRCIWSP